MKIYVNGASNWWEVSSEEIIKAISEYLEIPISIANILYNHYTQWEDDEDVFGQFEDLDDFLDNLYDDVVYIVDDLNEPERSQVIDALKESEHPGYLE